MEPGSTVSTKAALVLLAALVALNVYRAAMVPVTPPEAAGYNRFVGPSWREALQTTAANHHVLNTLLARISTSVLHLTDLSLRLPALLGCVLYFWAVFRLMRRVFGTGLLFVAAVALLSLNPLVLDYMALSCGHGLALAFWTIALSLMLEYEDSNQPVQGKKMNLAGVCLGLSVSASLAFVVPALALGLTFSTLEGPRRSRRRLPDFWLPAFISAFLILVIPLNRADFATPIDGATSLRQTLNSLTGLPPGWQATAGRIGAAVLAVAVIALAAQGRGRCGTLTRLTAGTIVVGFGVLELGHRWLKAPFPVGGSALYFIPLLSVAGLCIVERLDRRPVAWLLLLVSGAYLFQVSLQHYSEWPDYAGARSAVKALRQDAGHRPVRVAASQGLDEVLNYYRARYALRLWPPVQPNPRMGAFEYYVLNQRDAGLVLERYLKVLWTDGRLTLAR